MSENLTPGRKKAVYGAMAVAALVSAGGIGAGLNALFTDTMETEQATFQTGEVKIAPGTDNTYTTPVNNMAAGDTGYRTISVKNAGTIEWGKLEARATLGGPLTQSGIPYTGTPTQVNGDTAAGNGDTPLAISMTACDGGKWTLPSDASARPTCTGTEAPVKMENVTDATQANKDYVVTSALTIPNLTSANQLQDGNKSYGVLFNKLDDTTTYGANFASNQTAKPNEEINVLLTYHLPKEAKNEYMSTEGRTVDGNIKLTFTATQRDGKVIDGTLASQ